MRRNRNKGAERQQTIGETSAVQSKAHDDMVRSWTKRSLRPMPFWKPVNPWIIQTLVWNKEYSILSRFQRGSGWHRGSWMPTSWLNLTKSDSAPEYMNHITSLLYYIKITELVMRCLGVPPWYEIIWHSMGHPMRFRTSGYNGCSSRHLMSFALIKSWFHAVVRLHTEPVCRA